MGKFAMTQSRFVLLSTFIVYIVAACTPVTSDSELSFASGVTPTHNFALDWRLSHSPDGNWILKLDKTVTILSTSYEQVSLKQPSDAKLGEYSTFKAWFPDSNGVILFDADHGCEKCAYDRLVVLLINREQMQLQRFVYEPMTERNRSFWGLISWSPDGSKFAVVVDFKELVVLDRQANIIMTLAPALASNEILDHATWTTSGLAYVIRTLNGDYSGTTKKYYASPPP